MEVLETYDNVVNDLKDHLIRVGDVINIDGPVLSLFQDIRNKDLYLFDWVDSDDNTNRWLVYKVSAEILNQFLLHRISYKTMFESVNDDSFFYADIINSENINYIISHLQFVPEKYKPKKETFFDFNDSTKFDKITAIVNDLVNGKPKDESNKIALYKEVMDFVSMRQSTLEDDIFLKQEFPNQNPIVIGYFETTTLETQQDVITRNRIPREKRVGLYQ